MVFLNFWLVDEDFQHPMISLWGWITNRMPRQKMDVLTVLSTATRVYSIISCIILSTPISLTVVGFHEFALCLCILFRFSAMAFDAQIRSSYMPPDFIYQHRNGDGLFSMELHKSGFSLPQCGERLCIVGRARISTIIRKTN